MKKKLLVFVFQKSGKFWSISIFTRLIQSSIKILFLKSEIIIYALPHHISCAPLDPASSRSAWNTVLPPLFMCRVHLTFIISTRYIVWFRLVDLPNIFYIFVCHVTPNQILTIVSITGCNTSSGLQFFFLIIDAKTFSICFVFFLVYKLELKM